MLRRKLGYAFVKGSALVHLRIPLSGTDVVKKVLGDNPEVITCRPADLIPDELGTLEKEMEQYKEQDEDVLSYALFPQVATDFFKYREAQEKKVDATIAKDGSYPV